MIARCRARGRQPIVEKIKAAKVGSAHRRRGDRRHDRQDRREHDAAARGRPLSVGKGVVASYVHNSVVEGLGKIGVLVALESAGKADELKRFGRMLAMHVAASNPQAIDSAGLDPEVVRAREGRARRQVQGSRASRRM